MEATINDFLTLTDFDAGDIKNLVTYLNDEELYHNTLRVPHPYTESHAEAWLKFCAQSQIDLGMPINFAIRHQTEGVIGGIGCFWSTGISGHRDEIGYWMARPFRGRGWMTEVVRRFCAKQFYQRPTLNRLEAFTKTNNHASGRVLEKVGFRREGYLHNYHCKEGAPQDSIIYGLIRPWFTS